MEQAGVGVFIRGNIKTSQSWATPKSLSERLERRLWKNYPFRNLGQFLFFVFRKVA